MVMDIFRKVFGLPNRNDQFCPSDNNYSREEYRRNKEHNENFNSPGFDVFTDPLQMHQFFEQEMNNMLRNFGLHGFDNFFSGFDNFPMLRDNSPYLDTTPQQQPPSKDLRDQFLKHGYDKPTQYSEKADKDLDDKVILGDIDSILGDSSKEVTPFEKKHSPSSIFYAASQSLSTITHPDGTMETKQNTKDNEGNEETITCHIFGDKQYCVIKKKDREGREELTEQYVNMNENEKEKLFGPRGIGPNDDTNIFPFDNFFK